LSLLIVELLFMIMKKKNEKIDTMM